MDDKTEDSLLNCHYKIAGNPPRTATARFCKPFPAAKRGPRTLISRRKNTREKIGGSKMKKRLLSVLMCLSMVLSLLPAVTRMT